MSAGWYFARRRDAGDARIEVVSLARTACGRLAVAIAGDDRQFLPSDFEWLGPVLLPISDDQDAGEENYAAPIARHLRELVSLMRTHGCRHPRAGVTLSATLEGVVVGLYLYPGRNAGVSRIAPDLTTESLGWARRQITILSTAPDDDRESA